MRGDCFCGKGSKVGDAWINRLCREVDGKALCEYGGRMRDRAS
jgi:hypothetical protein